MKKTLYSLMLSEEVVREVDALAHRMGTNRSNLINQILAEYCDLTTPERRINDILSQLEALLIPSRELVPFFSRGAFNMSLKSSLEYKYRPTVKYEVQLFRGDANYLGELSVVFRSQSAALLEAMGRFFRLWKRVEDAHLAPLLAAPIRYALAEGKFLRSIALPQNREHSADDIAGALSDYISLFDALLKGFLSGRLTAQDVEAEYYARLGAREVLI